jgi:hypothetical protein
MKLCAAYFANVFWRIFLTSLALMFPVRRLNTSEICFVLRKVRVFFYPRVLLLSTQIPGYSGFLCDKAGVLFPATNLRPDIITVIRK